MSLDKTDLMILNLLQTNAHLTIKEIAAAVNMSLTPVHERIKKMQSDGVIEKYVTLLDKKKLGKTLIVYCNITLTKQAADDFKTFNEAIDLLKPPAGTETVAGKVKVTPSVKRQPPRFIEPLPRLCNSMNSSSLSPEIGLYMISLITMSRLSKALLFVPGVFVASSLKPGAPSGWRPDETPLACASKPRFR